MTSRNKMSAIFCPSEAIHRSNVRLGVFRASLETAVSVYPRGIIHIQATKRRRTPSNVPKPNCTINSAAYNNVLSIWTPCCCKYGTIMASKAMSVGATPEIYKSDSRQLSRTRNEEMASDRRNSMRIDRRPKIKRCRRCKSKRGAKL